MYTQSLDLFIFFFNDTATTEIYTLSLHDALPILLSLGGPSHATTGLGFVGVLDDPAGASVAWTAQEIDADYRAGLDRKSTRLNSSHANISYAVFCLKKKKSLTVGLPCINVHVFYI